MPDRALRSNVRCRYRAKILRQQRFGSAMETLFDRFSLEKTYGSPAPGANR